MNLHNKLSKMTPYDKREYMQQEVKAAIALFNKLTNLKSEIENKPFLTKNEKKICHKVYKSYKTSFSKLEAKNTGTYKDIKKEFTAITTILKNKATI